MKVQAAISSKHHRKSHPHDTRLYKQRNRIERYFERLKHFRMSIRPRPRGRIRMAAGRFCSRPAIEHKHLLEVRALHEYCQCLRKVLAPFAPPGSAFGAMTNRRVLLIREIIHELHGGKPDPIEFGRLPSALENPSGFTSEMDQ